MSETIFGVDGLHVHEIPQEHVNLMMTEGNMYHATPSDLKKSVDGMVDFWRTGKSTKLDRTPIADMYFKLVNNHGVEPAVAYNLTEKFLMVKVFTLVSGVEE